MKFKILMIVMFLLGIVLVSGCVPETTEGKPDGSKITIELSSFRFTPNTITVKEGAPITFILINKDAFHTFTIPELGIDVRIPSGETKEITITPDKTGEFKLTCTVPGHDALGMNGKVIVE